MPTEHAENTEADLSPGGVPTKHTKGHEKDGGREGGVAVSGQSTSREASVIV